MRVAELIENRRFRIVDEPVPDPAPGEIQARVRTVGVCGSDLHYFSEGGVGDTPCVYPMVLGHEPTGEVTRTGAGVSGWQPGDLVILEPAVYCYHCELCRAGRHNLCSNLKFFSTPGTPGFFREFVNLPAHNILPLPRELDLNLGTLFEPLAIILHSMKFAAPSLGDTAAVFGAGPIGLLTVVALKLAGASRVWCVDPLPHRRELAKQMGADAMIDPTAVDPVRQIQSDTGKRGVDIAIDCASKDNTINQCLDVARSAGRVVITGIPSEAQVKLNFHVIRRKELFFYTVRRSNHETETGIQMLRENPKRFAPLITHARPLEEIEKSFHLLENYEDGVGKIVVTL